MSVKRIMNWLSQARVDLPHLKSVESAVQSDFDTLLKAFATGANGSFVLNGFTINASGIGSPASALSMAVADGALFHGTSNVAGTFYLVDSSAPVEILNPVVNSNVVGSFTQSAFNYVGIEYERSVDDSTADIVYFWNESTKDETSKLVPLAKTLKYKIVITTTPWAANVLPISKVEVNGSGVVTSITDDRPMFFRLGQGGYGTPDPSYNYPWSDGRDENPSTSTSPSVDPFFGGDKQIGSLKDLIDAILTTFKEIKGTTYWYSPGTGGGSIIKLREDAINTVVTGSGSIIHDLTTPGKMNWDQDIYLKLVGSALSYRLAANVSSSNIVLADNQVAYLNLVRDAAITPNLIFTNGSATVTSVGAVTWTTNLLAGDYIKVKTANDSKYYKIQSVDSGSQVTLTTNYAETSTGASGAQSVYAYGSYLNTASPTTDRYVQVADRGSVPFSENMYWLFLRADNGSSPAIVYARFFGEELIQGESEHVGEGISNENLAFMGATSAADSTPSYSTQSLSGPSTGNNFVSDGDNLTQGIHTMDVEANSPLRPHAAVGTADQKLYFEDSSVPGADSTVKTVGPIKNSVFFGIVGASIDFGADQPTGTPSGDFNISSITPVDAQYYAAAFSLGADGKIQVNFSDPQAAAIDLEDESLIGALFPTSNSPLGYVFLQYFTADKWRTVGSVSAVIENDQIYRFGSGAGGGGSESSQYNDDLISMLFRAKITDEFTEAPTNSASTLDSTETTASYVAAKQMYQISYDASKTVTGTGTSMVLSAAPSFTVAVGDILVVGNEANQISSIGSINIDGGSSVPFVLANAFSSDPSVAVACVSQKVQTKDIYGTYSNDGTSLYDIFSGASFAEILIDYEDSTTVNDNIFDITSAPVVQWQASNGSSYTTCNYRPTLQTTTAQTTFLTGAATSLYVRFFAKHTSGSGSVNLIDYRAYMQKDPTSAYGSQNSAIGYADNSATPVNMTVSTLGGLTTIELSFPYAMGVSSGSPYGALDVYLNGQIAPRYISGSTATAYYTELNSTTIQLDQDYSFSSLEILIVQRVTVTDTSTQNTTNIVELQSIATPQNHIVNGVFDIAQAVALGTATTVNTASTTSTYYFDMWRYSSAGTTVKNYSINGDSSVLPTYSESGFGNSRSMAFNMITGIGSFAAGDYVIPTEYMMEGKDYQEIYRQNITLGFWAYASVTGTYNVAVRNGTPDRSYVTTFTIDSANTWEFKTITIAGDSGGTWSVLSSLGMSITIGSYAGSTYTTSTLNAWQNGNYLSASTATNWMATSSNKLYIAQVSLVRGNFGFPANNFARNGKSFELELATCQRYFYKTYNASTAPGTAAIDVGRFSARAGSTGAQTMMNIRYKAVLRATPTVTIYSPVTGISGKIRNATSGSDIDAAASNIGVDGAELGTTAAGFSSGDFAICHVVADARL